MGERVRLWLLAVRDAFIILLPVTFIGVVVMVLQALLSLSAPQRVSFLSNPVWSASLNLELLVAATHGIFSVCLVAIVAIRLDRALVARHGDDDEIPEWYVGLSALVNFMVFTLVRAPLSVASLGYDSMLSAMLIGVASAEALRALVRVRGLNLVRAPCDTEVLFYDSIRLCLPLMFSAVTAFMLAHLLCAVGSPGPHLLRPLAQWAQMHHAGVWLCSVLATQVNQIFWFFGVQGSHVLSAYGSDLFLPFGAGYDNTLAYRPLFNGFVMLGGSGATLGLLLAILLLVRAGPQRRVGLLSLLSSLFNINETLLFGLPLVFRPVYLLPFLLVPAVLAGLTGLAVQLGLIAFTGRYVPWTTPPVISGWLLTGSWRGAAWQLAELALSTAMYWPFVLRAEARRVRDQGRAFAAATQAILSDEAGRMPAIRLQGQVGMIARALWADLQADLKRNVLTLAYQPKHDGGGRLVGVEALLRWNHAHHGPVSPLLAIVLAEDGGEIHRLGRWVLRQACACKARWNARGYRALTMAVNVSPAQLTDLGLADFLERCLYEFELEPQEIELEITESTAIPDSAMVDQTLRSLSQTGVRFAMDDFGMGHSSLLYLRRFQVHAIKIDGSLTREVLSNSTNADIIRSIVSLGRARGVEVVAEFVETQEQREALAQMGCDLFQGYLHSPPLDEVRCLNYFQSHPPIRGGRREAAVSVAFAQGGGLVP
ncbi:EAL domain-containing protein [Paludibacterium yongneupense]|uniref:EAL domain-containing protein n=1 Tax=Paludibacterium yongneupense TaxID=400061 RepID=UPI0003F88EF6|nr:EAL domain-containing protein [Paludibacterium yongneupense]